MSKSGDERSDKASSRESSGAVIRGAGKASVQLPVVLLGSAISKMDEESGDNGVPTAVLTYPVVLDVGLVAEPHEEWSVEGLEAQLSCCRRGGK
jgi:hypothetical protein